MLRCRWIGAALAACAVLTAAGCGYIGEPLPPLLHIPRPVADLRAVQRADRVIVEFTVPTLTTEGAVLKQLGRLELRAGPGPEGSFSADAWASTAKVWDVPAGLEAGRFEIPAADWVGREIVLAMKAFGANGRDAGWSNLVVLSVAPPLGRPQDLKAAAVREGVRLEWKASAPSYRVFRRGPGEKQASEVARTDRPEWVDTSTEYDKPYLYRIQAFQQAGSSTAESQVSDWAEIVPKDTYAPTVPSGVKAIAGARTIELAWERGAEPDLAGYRVYRSEGDGPPSRVAETLAPTYSDVRVESGKRYRYAVSSFDALGNESSRSEPVEIAAP
jgi:hypothetical protein